MDVSLIVEVHTHWLLNFSEFLTFFEINCGNDGSWIGYSSDLSVHHSCADVPIHNAAVDRNHGRHSHESQIITITQLQYKFDTRRYVLLQTFLWENEAQPWLKNTPILQRHDENKCRLIDGSLMSARCNIIVLWTDYFYIGSTAWRQRAGFSMTCWRKSEYTDTLVHSFYSSSCHGSPWNPSPNKDDVYTLSTSGSPRIT